MPCQAHALGCGVKAHAFVRHIAATRRPAAGALQRRRRGTPVHASASASDDPFNGDAELQRALDESFDTIKEILDHVCNNMVAENAVAFVTVSAADQTPAKLMSQAVEERLSRLNQMTLHTIHSLLASSTVKRDPQTAALLQMMKKEILKQTANALPTEIRTLDSLISERDEEQRTKILHELPEDLLEGLALAAGQVISDMEETAAIADVPLLCGAVLARDDVLNRLEALREGAAADARVGRKAVPQSIAAVVKELVLVGDPITRQTQLFSLLKQGCQAPQGSTGDTGAAGHAHGHSPGGGGGAAGGAGLVDAVRPGALLFALDIIRHEMAINPPPSQGDSMPQSAMLRRLADIKSDALQVVQSIRDGKLSHLSPAK